MVLFYLRDGTLGKSGTEVERHVFSDENVLYGVPQILAGSPFPLSESELKEITYLGVYVSESLAVIRSILSYNSCSGGYIIYHESFRRYVLELLEKNEVSVDKAIYSYLIDWLKNRGFYEDRKSYLNLLVLLFESKRYDEILEYCIKELVVDSVFYGNNINSLKSNFGILMKTSCKVKDYGAVIICPELSNMIFKGKPRTCDLYKYETIIFESIVSPLELVSNESTWRTIIGLIAEMSSETMTTLNGSTSGPLPTYKLFDLFLEIANDTNCEVLTEIFEDKIGDEDKRRFYSYLVDYSLKYAIILAKSGRLERAKVEFRRGVVYLLSYPFRKDRTLSRLIDSVESIYKIDEKTGIQNILRLKSLADAVVYHTDGRSTKIYQKEWFEVLARTDREIALTHLSYELLDSRNYWVLEESLDSLLEIMNSEVDPLIENALFRTRPNHVSFSAIRS